MLFAIIFTDKPGCGDLRAANLQAHVDWLEANQAIVPIGGSLRRALGEVPIGGLWIAEAESESQLDALIRTDPFYIAGLRQGYDVLHWSKANENRAVVL